MPDKPNIKTRKVVAMPIPPYLLWPCFSRAAMLERQRLRAEGLLNRPLRRRKRKGA